MKYPTVTMFGEPMKTRPVIGFDETTLHYSLELGLFLFHVTEYVAGRNIDPHCARGSVKFRGANVTICQPELSDLAGSVAWCERAAKQILGQMRTIDEWPG